MASGWTESGINWENLQAYDPRQVIRQLYIAVSERHYWLSFFGSGGYCTLASLEAPDYAILLRPRTKSQVRFILEKVNTWLSDPVAYTLNGNDTDPLKGGAAGCLVDYASGSPYAYTQYGDPADYVGEYNVATQGSTGLESAVGALQLGYNSYGISAGGNTESLIGLDLNFMRRYRAGESQRFTYEMMYAVYKLLTNLRYCRRGAYSYSQFKTAVNAIPTEAWRLRWNGTEFEDVQFIQAVGSSVGVSFNAQRQDLYDTADCTAFNFSLNYNTILGIGGQPPSPSFGLPERWSINNFGRNLFSYYEYTGYNGQQFKTGDFDFKSLIYSIGYKRTNIPSSWPSTGYREMALPDFSINRATGHTILDNNTEFLSNQGPPFEIDVNVAGDYLAHSFGWYESPDVPDSVGSSALPASGTFLEQSLPLINFDKEGFLKYYTENP